MSPDHLADSPRLALCPLHLTVVCLAVLDGLATVQGVEVERGVGPGTHTAERFRSRSTGLDSTGLDSTDDWTDD